MKKRRLPCKLRFCRFCNAEFRGRSQYCKKGCRALYSQAKKVRITEVDLNRGSIDYDQSLAAGKPVRSFAAIKRFLSDRGILIEEKKDE